MLLYVVFQKKKKKKKKKGTVYVKKQTATCDNVFMSKAYYK